MPRSVVRRLAGVALPGVLLSTLLAGCSSGGSGTPEPAAATGSASDPSGSTASSSPAAPATRVPARFRHPIPGMPAVQDGDVYAATRRQSQEQARVRHDPAYLYVPNSYGAPITTVIDQRTRKVVRVLHTGLLSQHVTPSWDLRRLYVEASESNRIDAIDPRTGRITH